MDELVSFKMILSTHQYSQCFDSVKSMDSPFYSALSKKFYRWTLYNKGHI